MFRTLLKSKIHRAAVTHCELHYEGSCAIDENLLETANIAGNEQIHIWSINNGERFITYAIKGQRGSGMISVNGSAARRAAVGDLIIIASFAQVGEEQVAAHKPQLVFVDEAQSPDRRAPARADTAALKAAMIASLLSARRADPRREGPLGWQKSPRSDKRGGSFFTQFAQRLAPLHADETARGAAADRHCLSKLTRPSGHHREPLYP